MIDIVWELKTPKYKFLLGSVQLRKSPDNENENVHVTVFTSLTAIHASIAGHLKTEDWKQFQRWCHFKLTLQITTQRFIIASLPTDARNLLCGEVLRQLGLLTLEVHSIAEINSNYRWTSRKQWQSVFCGACTHSMYVMTPMLHMSVALLLNWPRRISGAKTKKIIL